MPRLSGPEDRRAELARFLTVALGARHVTIDAIDRLSGGAIQENYGLDLSVADGPHAGSHRLVLRMDAPSGVAVSHSRAQEFAILRAVHAAGVKIPEPIALCADAGVLGRPFYLMRRLAGTAGGHILTRDDKWAGDRVTLAFELGRQLATLHKLHPPQAGLDFLPMPVGSPARAAVAEYRAWLAKYREPRPALEWGLAWLDAHAPSQTGLVLCHRDFRTGNYLVDAHGLSGVLDWEFAGWGDPAEDLGWFCAKCWRFGVNAREAGGVGARADFYRGYQSVAGGTIDPQRVAYWEIMAHARWAVIAIQQGERHVSGDEPSLSLALTGRRVAELEYELLRMTAPETW